MRSLLSLTAFVVPIVVTHLVLADNPSSALDELKAGYALKQQGNCREALAHFTRSAELDPKPKALLNLADCEQQLGNLVAAEGHASRGRQLAQWQSAAELAGVADAQIAAIDKRLPRLTIRLAAGSPPNCAVIQDGVSVKLTSLGVPVVANPGRHTIVVIAPDRGEGRFEVTLAEGAREQVDVGPGPLLLVEPAPSPPAVPQQGTSPTWMIATYGAIGVGAAGLTIGVVAGVAADSKYAALKGECNGNDCPTTAQGDLSSFRSLRTSSTVGYVVGAAGLVGGAALWLWLPRRQPTRPTAGIWLGPASVGASGSF